MKSAFFIYCYLIIFQIFGWCHEYPCEIITKSGELKPSPYQMTFVHPRGERLSLRLPKIALKGMTMSICLLANAGNVTLFAADGDLIGSESEYSMREPVIHLRAKISDLQDGGGSWEVKIYNPYDFEALTTKERSLRYVAAMTKGSRLLGREDVLELKPGYFVTKKGGFMDVSHLQSGINDTFKLLRELHRVRLENQSIEISDHMYWDVQGNKGFDFRLTCRLKPSDRELIAHAVVVCLFRHYIWECLQQNPKVVSVVGKMSQGSSFAAEDITSYYMGIIVAHRMTRTLGEVFAKGRDYIKTRKAEIDKLLNELVFVSPQDSWIQDNYYEIVDILAKKIVIDPTEPCLWGNEKNLEQPEIFRKYIFYELIESSTLTFSKDWLR